ncbi:MAG TPA: cytochrome ubiquinol oxidase subunit I, partial [Propionicimonas sp.]|nr:cytochrome ubiquinol oxidase subunit I [Propionicimonas sp.]
MTTIASRAGSEVVEVEPIVERKRWGTLAMKLLTTTDHKVIGNMYFVTSLAYFAFAGLLALAIRAELA